METLADKSQTYDDEKVPVVGTIFPADFSFKQSREPNGANV